jgi:hypothetical protein
MNRKAREEKARRLEKKNRKPGPVTVVTIPDGPSRRSPGGAMPSMPPEVLAAVCQLAVRRRKRNRGSDVG